MTAVESKAQERLPLAVKRHAKQEVSDDLIAAKSTFHEAIVLCAHIAPIGSKVISMELGIDQAQWSRIMSGQAHFPPNKLADFMDICGNEVPLRWLALSRGYGLVRLQSEVERENEQLQLQNQELSKKLAHFQEFMALAKKA